MLLKLYIGGGIEIMEKEIYLSEEELAIFANEIKELIKGDLTDVDLEKVSGGRAGKGARFTSTAAESDHLTTKNIGFCFVFCVFFIIFA